MRGDESLLSYNMRRRLAMSGRGGTGAGEEPARARSVDTPPAWSSGEIARGGSRQQSQQSQQGLERFNRRPGSHSGTWRTSGDNISRTGRQGYTGAGQGAWLQQGPRTRRDPAPYDRLEAGAPSDPRQLGAQPAPHSGFAQAQRLAQQAVGLNHPGGFTPRHDWESIMNQRQGGGVQTTGAGLGGEDVVDLGDTRMDQRAPAGGGSPAVETSRSGTGLQAGDNPPPAEEPPPAGEEEFDPAAFEQQRQEANEWFSSVFGVTIEEYAEAQGVDVNMIYGLFASPYVDEIAFIDGTPQVRLDYARLTWELLREQVGGNFNSYEEFLQYWNGDRGYGGDIRDRDYWISQVNKQLGLPGHGPFDGPDKWNEFSGLPESVWGLFKSDYRNSIDAYNQSLDGGGGGTGGEGATGGGGGQPIEGGFNNANADPWEEYYRQLQETEVPQFDQAAVEDLILSQQREADLRNAQAMRAAMHMGGRTGVAPEASLGRMQQQMQQSGVNAANIRAQQQMQAEIQNFEAQIRHYQNQIDGFRMAAQHSNNAELQSAAAAQAQRLARVQGQMQQQLMQRQWQLNNTFGVQTGLDLVGDLGGAIIGAAF